MVAGKHLPGSAKTGGNFISDHQNIIPVAQFPNPLQKSGRVNDHPSGTLNKRLNDKPGNQAFIWIGDADFSTPGQLRYAYAGGNTIVSGNLDSDQLAEFQIVLTGHFTLIAGDFVL